jgi:hypothetical protein
MNKLIQKIASLFISLFFSFSVLSAQDFPESWVGHWKGNMQLTYTSGKTMSVNNELIIKFLEVDKDSLEHYQWTIIYGEGAEKQERAYELITVDAEKGLYKMDEKNTIILPFFYADNTLMCLFEVMGNYIMSTYRQEGGFIYFENVSANNKNTETSGGEGDVPTVTSYPISNLQRAKLSRVK